MSTSVASLSSTHAERPVFSARWRKRPSQRFIAACLPQRVERQIRNVHAFALSMNTQRAKAAYCCVLVTRQELFIISHIRLAAQRYQGYGLVPHLLYRILCDDASKHGGLQLARRVFTGKTSDSMNTCFTRYTLM